MWPRWAGTAVGTVILACACACAADSAAVTLTAKTEREEFCLGDRIVVTSELRNEGAATIVVDRRSLTGRGVLLFLGEALGDVASMSWRGDGVVDSEGYLVAVAPGEKISATRELDAKKFDGLRVGNYEILLYYVTISDGKLGRVREYEGEVVSKSAKFVISDCVGREEMTPGSGTPPE